MPDGASARSHEGEVTRHLLGSVDIGTERPLARAPLQAAMAAHRAVLATDPNNVPALFALGMLSIQAARPRDAARRLRQCVALAPGYSEAWAQLSRACLAAGEPDEALAAAVRAQRLAPRSFALAPHLAEAAIAANRAAEQVTRLEALSDRDPLNPVPHIARGLILDRLGLLDSALDALEAAVALAPGAREPLRILAGVLSRTAHAARAEAALREALECDPGDPRLMNDHAAVLMRLHRHAEARDLLREVLRITGPHAPVVCNLANATVCLGSQDEAVELAHAAIVLEPRELLPRRALANTLPYHDDVTGAALLEAARGCAEVLPRGSLPELRRIGDPNKSLTIGLLSGTLRTHPVGWLTVAGFEHLDRAAFQIVCLSRAPEPNDPMAERFRTVAKSWENVSVLDDDALARHARELGIDILIDLGGHGDAARMVACARRLAPVQIKWVGMQNHSSGLPEMDWFLTDRWETPPALEALYSERLLRMPDGYVCYSPPAHAPDVVPPPASRNGFITFGCFNNIAKITPSAIASWCEVLRATPKSRLILKTHQLSDPPTAERFLLAFDQHGIDRTRVETRGSSPHRVFLANYNDIDIVLDPFPYSGGLTTCEALWMGVPTVTLPGETFASRHSASHLSNAGFPEWVARDREDYVAIALMHADDVAGLTRSRHTMREHVRASPLCDAPRFGRALSRALRHAWTA
jgi:protein O-GlcNAc transferase